MCARASASSRAHEFTINRHAVTPTLTSFLCVCVCVCVCVLPVTVAAQHGGGAAQCGGALPRLAAAGHRWEHRRRGYAAPVVSCGHIHPPCASRHDTTEPGQDRHQQLAYLTLSTYLSTPPIPLKSKSNSDSNLPLPQPGHSLGAGVAALLTLLLRQPGRPLSAPAAVPVVHCLAIAPPAVLSANLAEAARSCIVSTVNAGDFVARLSCYSVDRALLELVQVRGELRGKLAGAAVRSRLTARTNSVHIGQGCCLLVR